MTRLIFCFMTAIGILGSAATTAMHNPSNQGHGTSAGVVSRYDSIPPLSSQCDSIAAALDYHIKLHPYSHYKDIYKSFMQDYFGPGHILINPDKSAQYLKEELLEESPFLGPLYEPTGYEGNFYRVNLSLLKDEIIPLDLFFNLFVESAQNVVPPSPEVWRSKWTHIDSCMQNKKYHFRNQEQERNEILKQVENGDFVVHHSHDYNQSSNFHYRIISKELFENSILPFVLNSNKHNTIIPTNPTE